MSFNGSPSTSGHHGSATVPTILFPPGTNDFQSQPSESAQDQISRLQIAGPDANNAPETLDQRLWGIAVSHPLGLTYRFWPPSAWRALVTEKAIVDELLELNLEKRKAATFAKDILRPGSEQRLSVFTILLLNGNVNSVVHMMQHCAYRGIRDRDLPLEPRAQIGGNLRLFHRNGDPVAACCLSRWTPMQLETFSNLQRRLSPPVFRHRHGDNTLIHLDLDDQDILPWCELRENLIPVPAMSGGFGTVNRVRIHPMCHRFNDTLKAVSDPAYAFAPQAGI